VYVYHCVLKVVNLHLHQYILVFIKSELVSFKVLTKVLMQFQAVGNLTPFNTYWVPRHDCLLSNSLILIKLSFHVIIRMN